MNETPSTTDPFSERLWFLRRPTQFLADVAVLTTAFLIAYLPALNLRLGEFYVDNAINQLPFVILIQFSSLFLVGTYSIIWRYVSLEDISTFIKAAILSAILLLTARFTLSIFDYDAWQVPVSVILIDTFLAFGGLLALRVVRRFAYEIGEKRGFSLAKYHLKRKPTLLIGAGRIGAALAKEVVGRADSELQVRGFIDDDRSKKGGSVSGIKVLGTTGDLPRLADELNIEQVVITLDEAPALEIRRILDVCHAIPVKTQIVPSLNEIAHGRINVSRLRDVQIEDLLGRDPVELDDENLHAFLGGKVVMVTGAGGSIGSELVRQITVYNPQTILLIERAEFLLFQIEQELARDFSHTKFLPLLADVGDEPRMREIFEIYKPGVIFHAAAHKHVSLMEANSGEAIKNNVFGTQLVGRLAGEYATKDFVLVSTDKAVNPTSVMGASKRVAELVTQAQNMIYATNYMTVRFGNVLGSAGSVVPIFREQINRGEAITVTDKKMTRYFMTIPEASQLVLQAGALGDGGEIFILDMGEPVKILDLAEDMIRLSGLKPYEDIDIYFTGIRKGEKLFEELEITGEDLLKTKHPKIYIGKIATYTGEEVGKIIKEFHEAVEKKSDDEIRRLLNFYLPEANITEKIKVKSKAAVDSSEFIKVKESFKHPDSALET